MFCLITYVLCFYVAVDVKVRVRCNQTGKYFVASLSHLEDAGCRPVLKDQLKERLSVFWVDTETGKSYPVTVMKVLAPGGKFCMVMEWLC